MILKVITETNIRHLLIMSWGDKKWGFYDSTASKHCFFKHLNSQEYAIHAYTYLKYYINHNIDMIWNSEQKNRNVMGGTIMPAQLIM